MDGLLLIDKPTGWTSFDAVAKVRNLLRKEAGHKVKVGHTGTLDPLATGLLVLTVGSYCKKASDYSKLDKTYQVEMRLGETSSTGDAEGDKTKISTQKPTTKEIKSAIEQFIGQSQQTPPAFSAIKVNGKRAYKLAREGKQVELEPRTVQIYSISELSYNYPVVTFKTKVSSGTYIRSLVEDIGKVLKTGAYMSALARTEVDKFSLKDAVSPEQASKDKLIVA